MTGTCGKCGGVQEEGVLADTVYHATFVSDRQAVPAEWVRGPTRGLPRANFWSRIRNERTFVPPRPQARPIQAMRCTRCGFIEQYAR